MEQEARQRIAAQQSLYEGAYLAEGMAAQRLYPNEEFVRFMGRHFFPTPRRERPQISVLEIGCGAGSNLWMVAKEGFDAHGMDFAPAGIASCSETMQKWGLRFHCYVGEMMHLGFRSGQFSAVADVFSVTHLPFDLHERIYSEVYRVLKPGGRFFSYHPSDRCYSFQHSGSQLYDRYTVTDIINDKAPYRGNGLMCFLPAQECRQMLGAAGFTDIKIERIGRTYEDGEVYFEFLSVDAEKPKSDG